MSISLKIKLIHIEDPDEIYIKFLEGEKSKNNKKIRRRVYDLQKKLEKLAKSSKRVEKPKFGEIYGCYNDSWKKWIRGKVVSKLTDGFKIFCMDHGHYSFKISEIIEIPEEIKTQGEKAFYVASLGLKSTSEKKWSEQALKICRDLEDNRNKKMDLRFVPFYEEQDVFIGDIVASGDQQYSLSEKLIASNAAERSNSDFKTLFSKMCGKNIGPISSVQPKKRLEMYKCNDDVPNVPSGIFLHGENLKSAWSDIDDSDFSSILKKKFHLKHKNLSDVQSALWPQLCDKKHSVIISNQNECLTSTYLLPLINSINQNQNYRRNQELMGPAAIIFASNTDRVYEIVKRCEEYSKSLRIIKATGMCSSDIKFDVINGCDILISTLPAFYRLFENIEVDVIEENKHKWTVFDGFDSFQQFDKELALVIHKRYKKTKIPQTIVASKTIVNGIKRKILGRIPMADTVFCMDRHLDAAAFVGLSIIIEVSTSIDDKINKLLKIDFQNFEKTVIVVSENETAVKLENEMTKFGLKALNGDSVNIAKSWDELSTNKCILIITEDLLNSSVIKNVDNLVHFDLPSKAFSAEKFTKRFKVFANGIERQLKFPGEASNLKTKIILSDENMDQFESLIKFLIARNLLKPNDKVAKAYYEKNEAVKCVSNVILCPNVLKFGKCTKFTCPNRHNLIDEDKPADYLEMVNSYIKFDCVSMEGPTTFNIRLREYYHNNKWISFDMSNVQKILSMEMQNYCSIKKNLLSSNEGKIGEIYAKFDNNRRIWIRGKMVKRASKDIIILNLLDQASTQDIPAIEKNLVKLPEEYTKLSPLISRLQVMNLVPLDGEDSYSAKDSSVIEELLCKVPKNSVFVAKIETKISNLLFTKNIEAKNAENSVVFRLNVEHTKAGISKVSEDFEFKIKELAVQFQKVAVYEEVQEILQKPQMVPKKRVTEWKQLSCDEDYYITLKHYESPDSFLVVINNPENLTLKNALKSIEESNGHKLLLNPQVNDCCLVEVSGHKLRAKIFSIDGEELKVLLVDYGDVITCSQEQCFEIPDNFLTLRFQALHCSMLGVCPRFNMSFWPSLQKSEIYRLLSMSGESLQMNVARKDDKKNIFSETGINCYEVLLYDDVTDAYLHEIAIQKGIASPCKNFNEIKAEHDSVIDDASNSSDYDDDEAYEALEKLLKSTCQIKEEVSDYGTQISSTEDTASSTSSSKSTQPSSQYRLKSMYKCPYIEWRQSEALIYMLISAKDCMEYALKVTRCSIDVTIKYAEGKFERAIIQLYGSVEVKLCSHELAGINIIVRLPKKINFVQWPRLTESHEKSQFIKYSTERPPAIPMTLAGNQHYGEYGPDISDSEVLLTKSSSSDDESD